ncbi:MAG TPA: hypothetical protein VLX85_01020 [Stellaceae bacterium]|nr:hypothetical protein [Stellaceae bacterium]
MKVAAWVIAVLLLLASFVLFFEALTAAYSVWLSLPMLLLAGMLMGPGLIALLGLLGVYDLVVEVNGHRMEFRKWRGE